MTGASVPGGRRTGRSGLAVGLLGAALLGLGLAFDLAVLYPAAVGLMLLASGALVWVTLAARGATVGRELASNRALEGEVVELRVVARAGRARLSGGELRDPLLAAGAVPIRPGARRTAVRIQARFSRRGRRRLAPPRLVIRDPLGLVSRTRVAPAPDELLILPRLEPVRLAPGGRSVLRRSAAGRPLPDAESDLDRLAPYRAGTPASRIHWPTLARGAGLHERRVQGEAERRPLVLLDTRLPAGSAAEAQLALDAAVRAAASLVAWLAHPAGVELQIGAEPRPHAVGPDRAGFAVAHVRLALVEPTRSAPALHAVRGRSGPVVYVAADATTVPVRALNAAGVTVVVVVPAARGGAGTAPDVPAGRGAVLAVSGCQGRVLAPRTARRAA